MTAFSPVTTPTRSRVAIFIDGDHIPPTFRATIAQQAARLGDVISTQLFCDLSLRADWAVETGLDVTHCKGRPGKNSADMSLCIAALDMAYRGLAHMFLIVSNDRDFEPLVRHLHRLGHSATQIKFLPPPIEKARADNAPPKPEATLLPPDPKPASLVAMVIAHIRENGGASGLPISQLNGLYKTLGFKISETTEKSWRAWLKARPQYFICDPKGTDARVRLLG